MTAAVIERAAPAAAIPDKDRTYPGLDVLRGWGAIAVVFFHSSNLLGIPLFTSCHLAVDMFFCMSGFVIAHAYDRRIPILGILGFSRVRLVRFYPLLMLGLAIGVVRCLVLIRFAHAPYSVLAVLRALAFNMFFLPVPPLVLSTTEISPLDTPAWSLIFEMGINLAYVLAFRWLTIRVLIAWVSIAFVGLVVAVITYGGLKAGPHWETFLGGLARVCFSFPLGVLLYRLNLPPIKLDFLVLPGLLALVCLGGSPWVDLAFVAIGTPLLVLIAAHSTPRWGALTAYLGATSYCLYAIHSPIIMLMDGACHRFGLSEVWPTLTTIAVLLAACPLLDRWYDRPIRRWISGLRASRPPIEAAY